ncbi:MAG: hypothetical protein MN733_20610 [Nitrososphaera sp.]|nr:hypothetical protein [Nitrososphaera sp.]
MPNHSDYPHGFSVYIPPRFNEREPRQTTTNTTELKTVVEYDGITIDLRRVREESPTVTHIRVERLEDRSEVRAIFENREEFPNPRYKVEEAIYLAKKAEHSQKVSEWEKLCDRWKAEEAAEMERMQRETYLNLKAKFEGQSG